MRKFKLEQSQKIVTVKYQKNCQSTKFNTRIVSSRLRDSRVRKREHINKTRGDWGEDWRRGSLPLSPFLLPSPLPPRTTPRRPLSHIKRSYFQWLEAMRLGLHCRCQNSQLMILLYLEPFKSLPFINNH